MKEIINMEVEFDIYKCCACGYESSTISVIRDKNGKISLYTHHIMNHCNACGVKQPNQKENKNE